MSTFTASITQGLGYCCAWRFFSLYRNNEQIAARLGYSARTVRRHRASAEACSKCKEKHDGDNTRTA